MLSLDNIDAHELKHSLLISKKISYINNKEAKSFLFDFFDPNLLDDG